MGTMENIVCGIIQAHYKCLSQYECDGTIREKEIAELRLQSKRLQAHTELARKYFEYQMKEREKLFHLASDLLETAMKMGNMELAQIAMQTIQIVHEKSPFSFKL